MFPLVPPFVSPDLIADLDAQLSHQGLSAVHVAPGPVLVGLNWDAASPVALDHPQLDSYCEAELIAARLNALCGTSDGERTRMLGSIKGAAV